MTTWAVANVIGDIVICVAIVGGLMWAIRTAHRDHRHPATTLPAYDSSRAEHNSAAQTAAARPARSSRSAGQGRTDAVPGRA